MRKGPQDQTTVVAQATPSGEGGLAVVRLSGPDAVAIAARVFHGRGFPQDIESHRAVFGEIIRPGGLGNISADGYRGRDVIDRVLALPLLAPRSYTGEDTVEFFCHGGRVVSAEVVAACCEAGAQPAPPGEFTRRAFLNGKLSLDQAEAVADLIHAPDSRAAQAAIRQIQGGFDQELGRIETPLLALLAELEGSFEFTDEEEFSVPVERVLETLKSGCEDIDNLLHIAPAGRLLREGVQVVFSGPPNVGKSSLFNALLQEQRAIVDESPGTTRDVVSARIVRGGQSYVLHDTAGLRPAGGAVEQKGIALTLAMIEKADIVLRLVEADGEDATGEPPAPLGGEANVSTPVVVVVTKCDQAETEGRRGSRGLLTPSVRTSSLTGEGLDELWQRLERVTAEFHIEEALSRGVVLNDRHRAKLVECLHDLQDLILLQGSSGSGPEVTATILAGILAGLGEVSGRVFTEQLLDSIFKRFCVGK